MKNKIRILIVEDEYAIDERVLCSLNDLDYEIVKTVFHSQVALEYLVSAKIDFVLIDANLKDERSGWQLAEIIKYKFQIPYLFLISTSKQICIEKLREVDSSVIVLENPTLNQLENSLTLSLNNCKNFKSHLNQEKEENSTLDYSK